MRKDLIGTRGSRSMKSYEECDSSWVLKEGNCLEPSQLGIQAQGKHEYTERFKGSCLSGTVTQPFQLEYKGYERKCKENGQLPFSPRSLMHLKSIDS